MACATRAALPRLQAVEVGDGSGVSVSSIRSILSRRMTYVLQPLDLQLVGGGNVSQRLDRKSGGDLPWRRRSRSRVAPRARRRSTCPPSPPVPKRCSRNLPARCRWSSGSSICGPASRSWPTKPRSDHIDLRADLDAGVEVFNVHIQHADAARGDRLADRIGLIRPVDAEAGVAPRVEEVQGASPSGLPIPPGI